MKTQELTAAEIGILKGLVFQYEWQNGNLITCVSFSDMDEMMQILGLTYADDLTVASCNGGWIELFGMEEYIPDSVMIFPNKQ